MKKLLLVLVILGFSISAQAQGTLNLTQPVNNTAGNETVTVGQAASGVIDFGNQVSSGFSGFTGGLLGIFGQGSQGVQDVKELIDCAQGDRSCNPTPEGSFVLPAPEEFNTIGENISLRQFILNVLNFFLSFLGLIATAALIYAGFLYVTSGGDDSASEKSKKILIFAVVGILLILASFAIVNTVLQNAGRGTDDRNGASDISVNGTTNAVVDGVAVPGLTTTSSASGLRSLLTNPITLSGTGVQDSINSGFASLEGARQGVSVGLSTQALAIIDFGDGFQDVLDTTQDTGAVLTHAYGEVGTYNIAAVVETLDGQVQNFRKTLNVGSVAPSIQVSSNQVAVNQNLALSANIPSNQPGTTISLDWSCSGGAGCFGNQSGEAINVSFSAPGSYTITLSSQSSIGQSSTQTVQIEVIGGTPTASFTARSTQNTNRPSEFRFDASASTNVRGNSDNLTFRWELDGIVRENNTPEMIFEFPNSGSAEVSLTVTQNLNGETLRSETTSQTIDIPSTLSVDFDVE